MRILNTFMIAACSMFVLAGCNSAKQTDCCCCAEEKEMNIQLYSARDLIGSAEDYAANHERVLKALADMGYSGVEAAHYGDGKFYGVSPEQFKADVEAAGLKVVSSHTGHGLSDEELATGNITEALAWWDEALPAHKAAGMEYVVVPHIGQPNTLKELQVICDYFNAVGKKCKDLGMKFGYHNHAFEMGRSRVRFRSNI